MPAAMKLLANKRIKDGKGLPKEDRDVVRAGLISRPIIVTEEKKLRDSFNQRRDVLGLTAITPAEGLELAKDT